MLARILYVVCMYGVVAFACGFVGAAVGIAASRTFRGERGTSWLLVLLGLVASGLFLMSVFVTYFGAFDRPMISDGDRMVVGILLLGVALATSAVVRSDHAAEAIIAGAAGAFLTMFGLAILITLMMGPGGTRATLYAAGTFVPALIGAVFGWGMAWRRDLDDLLDREIAGDATGPVG